MQPEWRSAAETAAAIRSGEISALAITQAALQRIDRLNPQLGAFTQVTHTRALETAQAVDRKLATGVDPGVLAGGGAILVSLILAAIAVFIIERQWVRAAAFAAAGAVLTFFGFMHGEAIGVGQSPLVALSYLLVAGWLLLVTRAQHAPVSTHSEAELEADERGAVPAAIASSN